MKQHSKSVSTRSNEEPQSQNTKISSLQGETIETCTMDPCPMKMESKTDHHDKCPDCGRTEEVGGVKE